ncbi:MAG: alpha-amylase family glycosyl hydrolase [Myxococcota bacterium]|nr:alpha-amylase family glycosyl hydrolase [Myxococcota bacterium]
MKRHLPLCFIFLVACGVGNEASQGPMTAIMADETPMAGQSAPRQGGSQATSASAPEDATGVGADTAVPRTSSSDGGEDEDMEGAGSPAPPEQNGAGGIDGESVAMGGRADIGGQPAVGGEMNSDVVAPPSTVNWPTRACWRTLGYWAEEGVDSVSLAGEFTCNAEGVCWGEGAWPMVKNPDAQRLGSAPCGAGGPCLFEVTLNPFAGFEAGPLYAYKFIVSKNFNDIWRLDPMATHHRYSDDCVNSALVLPACESGPEVSVTSMEALPGSDRVDLRFRIFQAADGTPPLNPKVTLNGDVIEVVGPDENGNYEYSAESLPQGKHHFDIEVEDALGREAERLRLPFWIEAEKFSWRDGLLYLLFIDRFANGDPNNDQPIDDPRIFKIANWHGGDLQGATQVLESGYFENLGVKTIWLSPVNQQVDAPMKARSSDHQIAPYHGYWPIRARAVEPRFGGNDALKEFVKKAHERGIRVLLDLINNQVHEDHEYVTDRPDWFRRDCVCGTDGCGWSQKPLSCLFASYLPDIDWTQPDARAQFIDDAVYWVEEFDVDGFRVDAVKHVETTAIYNLRSKLSQRFEQGGHRIIMLGETAVSQADTYNQLCLNYGSGYDWINAYTGPTALDGQFDFPTHHRTTGVWRGESLRTIDNAVNDMQRNFNPDDLHVQFLGSHDTARIASIANQHPGVNCRFPDQDGCDGALPNAADDDGVYARLKFAFGLLYTTPGIPLLYNGDEWAVPGGNDPDNRRGVPWADMLSALRVSDDAPTAQQVSFFEYMQQAGQLRATRDALRHGERTVLYVDDQTLIYMRSTDADAVLVALNQGGIREIRVDVDRWSAPDEQFERLLGSSRAARDNRELILTLDALSVTVLGKP